MIKLNTRNKVGFFLIFLFIGLQTNAQENKTLTVKNQLQINFFDVVELNQLHNLDLIIIHTTDTFKFHIDSIANFSFQLNKDGIYQIMVVKEGFETLNFELSNPKKSAELILEFFMPKKILTHKEKRIANKNSRHLPERPCDNCGGFKSIKPSYNEVCLIRYRTFVNGKSSTTSKQFSKLKHY